MSLDTVLGLIRERIKEWTQKRLKQEGIFKTQQSGNGAKVHCSDRRVNRLEREHCAGVPRTYNFIGVYGYEGGQPWKTLLKCHFWRLCMNHHLLPCVPHLGWGSSLALRCQNDAVIFHRL